MKIASSSSEWEWGGLADAPGEISTTRHVQQVRPQSSAIRDEPLEAAGLDMLFFNIAQVNLIHLIPPRLAQEA